MGRDIVFLYIKSYEDTYVAVRTHTWPAFATADMAVEQVMTL